jgi:transcriptional regulator with XRE-family HTH domain
MFQRFPTKLLMLRKQHGMSQEELAQKLNITRFHISHLESGKRKPGSALLSNIADVFGVTMEQLVKDDLEIDDTG